MGVAQAGLRKTPVGVLNVYHLQKEAIVERLTLILHLSSEQALDFFYNSDTYRHLSNRQGNLHLMSDAFLADEVILELQRKQGS